MSATNRGGERRPDDFYATPAWCVERVLEACELTGGRWLEPCAGDGAIIRAADRADVHWTACDIRPEVRGALYAAVKDTRQVAIIDFLAERADRWRPRYDVIITNPPYSLAREFIDACLPLADHVVMLLRLNFLASESRHDLFTATHPDVYVLPNRPSFTGKGTDATEYAWFHWHAGNAGVIRVLALTPMADRKAA